MTSDSLPGSAGRRAGLSIENLRGFVKGPFTADFAAGSCTVLTGPSGAGKSLLLRMIADLDPNQGRVLLAGEDRDAMPAPRWRRMVIYAAAESGWWAERVGEHMGNGPAARDLFPVLGLDPGLLDVPVTRLSTGERQRAALVRAMIRRPRFLLLDEPTSALDEGAKRAVEALLRQQAADGLGLVVVSHDVEQVRRLADRHFVLGPNGLEEQPA
jgi:putative ABC transport system ATP-binding protein